MTEPHPFTETYLEGPQGTKFLTRTYAPESPLAVLVFVHGFVDHVRRYTSFHGSLAKNGLAIFAYDQRGFGRTALDEKGKARKEPWNRGYAKTSWKEQLEDIEWAVRRAHETFPDLPLFLAGHSMGGGLAIAFNTRGASTPPSAAAVSLISGVIGMSPLLRQTHPASSIQKWIGAKLSRVMPYMVIPAPVNLDHLSHNPAVVKSTGSDPLAPYVGSLRGLSDMLDGGELLVTRDYKNWPADRPLVIFHGTADQVTDPKASQEFIDRVPTKDKKLVLYEGSYHEVWHDTIPEGIAEQMINDVTEWVKERASARAKTPDAKL
ncbi:alpha/beta-hydrolase [Heliocybe sulcata]|uniref:Alpha/beta-hydrolase n=1 Tax=Heliocybe sulcata TaxID=5364 RepID=A0A5C3N016_9AGAM|nr:alpha/beta-hydrolase [Heliocybe sulcata]